MIDALNNQDNEFNDDFDLWIVYYNYIVIVLISYDNLVIDIPHFIAIGTGIYILPMRFIINPSFNAMFMKYVAALTQCNLANLNFFI